MERKPLTNLKDLSLSWLDVQHPINPMVQDLQCLPAPSHYAIPSIGLAKGSAQRVLLALHRKNSVYVWGPPGTGKDAIIHAFSAFTRTPGVIYSFTAGTDVKRWFYSREISGGGTSWSYGALWRVLVDGVQGRDGNRYPAIVLFSDVDRGTPDQLEEFRLLLDTTSRRLVGPTGDVHTLFPGTQFAFTGNTPGSGDPSGKTSARIMDTSLIDRMGRFVEFHHMEWSDEQEILKSKFPSMAPILPNLGKAVLNLRKALKGDNTQFTLDGELSHRGICEILSECEDMQYIGKSQKSLLKLGFQAWLDRLDNDNKTIAKRVIDSAIPEGAWL